MTTEPQPFLSEWVKNRHRKVSHDYKFDSFDFYRRIPPIKTDDLYSTSNLSYKKYPSATDSDFKHWTVVSEGFPPGTTVDELKKFGRRKPLSHLKPLDNLRVEEGSTKPCISEYTREYHAYGPLDLNPLLDKTEPNKENTSYEEITFPVPETKLCDYPNQSQKRLVLKRPPNHLEPMSKDTPVECANEKNSRFHSHCEKRKLLRRSTALKPEGEMTNETEVRREYRAYPNPERAQMIRRLPSLKMEGKFEPMVTEQQDKFVAFSVKKRPIMEKKKTLLKMEGDFDFLTESNRNYVAHEPFERPRIRKRSTSLKLDGELEFFPEYRESFVDYQRTRPITYKPNPNLRQDEGELEKLTETKTQFVNFDRVQVPESAKPENNLHMEGNMEIVPEYKVNYVDFPRERPFVRRPLNQIRPEGELLISTENSEKFAEFPTAEKSESLKRTNNLRLEGNFEFVSEQNDKFKKPENPEKASTVKMAPSLKLEGDMNFVTEKADKYGTTIGERENTGMRPSSLRQLENEFWYRPEFLKPMGNYRLTKTPLKPLRNFRSNPPSPRRAPKDRMKYSIEEDKKFILATPSRRLSSRRFTENSRPIEKNLKFDLSHKNSAKLKDLDRRLDFHFPNKFKESESGRLEPYLGRRVGVLSPIQPKQFNAFHVLDVKGCQGCQTMRKDPVEGDRSTSEDESSTFRLEVSNSEKPGPNAANWKTFPPATTMTTTVTTEMRDEVERRARQRAETYEKIVKSPEVANYLLGVNNNSNSMNNVADKCWKSSGKLSPLFPPDNSDKLSFVVLDGSRSAANQTSKESVKGDNTNWEIEPGWMSSASIA